MAFQVVIGTYAWTLGGVAVFCANLARGLLEQGVSAHILVGGPRACDSPQPLPTGIPMHYLPVPSEASWKIRWRALLQYLEAQAPCVYVSSHDYKYAAVSCKLSRRVVVVGTLHSPWDVPCFTHWGAYWNATVAGSEAIAGMAASSRPELAPRIRMIPYGVSIPTTMPARLASPEAPLRIMYCGRLDDQGKRVFDLPKIVDALHARQVPVRLTLVGSGPDEARLLAQCAPLLEQGSVVFRGVVSDAQLAAIYQENDAFVLTSPLEGKPLSVIEAMGYGCVPVVTDLPSGIPELVQEGINGYRVPVGAIDLFADRLAVLYHHPKQRRAMAAQGYATIDQGAYRVHDMAKAYLHLMQEGWADAASGTFRRPQGRMSLPPFMKTPPHVRWTRWLPAPLRMLGHFGLAMLRQVFPARF